MGLIRIILRIVKMAIFKMSIDYIRFTYNHQYSSERNVRIKDLKYNKEDKTLSVWIDKDEFKSKFPELFKE